MPTKYSVAMRLFLFSDSKTGINFFPLLEAKLKKQVADLKKTIGRVKCDVVVSGTPIDLRRLLKVKKPVVQVKYELREKKKGQIAASLKRL